MKKIILIALVFLINKSVFGQQPSMTITNNTASYIITCVTTSINLTASVSPSNSSLSFSWVSQSANYTGSNVSITTGGVYTVTAFNSAASFSTSQTFTIRTNTFAPQVSISPVNPSITCSASTVNLYGSGNSGIPLNSGFSTTLPVICSSWAGPPSASSVNACSYVASTAGIYTLTVIDQNNGCKTSAIKVISDNRIYPDVSFGSPFNILCPNSTALIFPTLNGNSSAYTYSWIPPSGATISSLTTPSVTVNSPGTYQVYITNSTNGCMVNWFVDVQVCVGLTENSMPDLNISPNPTRGDFSIHLKDNEPKIAQIFNANGNLVRQQAISGKDAKISIVDLQEGIYFLRLMMDGKHSRYVKIIKLASE